MTQSPPPNPSSAPLNERIADIVLKVIMTGSVAGGGIGAFWQLFAQSDIPKAIASAVIGLGIAYAAKMLQPVHKGNERRLEDTGKALDRAIDSGIAKAMGVEDRYYQYQAWACRRSRSEGVAQYDGIFVPLLEEVFVPLDLDLSPLQVGFKPTLPTLDDNEQPCLPDRAGQDIWELLAKTSQQPIFRQIVILAWGGYGKTTLLKHIAYTYGMNQQGKFKAPRRIPVLLVLRKYRDLLAQDNPPSLPELIAQHHIPSLPDSEGLTLPPTWASDILKRGDAVVMLDGFDEVAKDQRPAVARWINQQLHRYGKSVFILTSRPKAYHDQTGADQLEFTTRLWVRDFNEPQRRRFVEQWYACQERYAHGGDTTPDVKKQAQEAANDLLRQVEARQELTDLAKNPLLLNMIVTFHRRFPGAKLPDRRTKLYQEICQLQLTDRPSARELDTLLVHYDAQPILQRLALEMMQQRQERIEHRPLLTQLKTYLAEQYDPIDPKELLDQIVQVSELLVAQEDEYEFAHLSFQEYLAATQLAKNDQEALLADHFSDDWWKQTILLYAAQVKNPTSLIRTMLDQGAIDLAYTCLQTTSKRIDPKLAAELDSLRQTVQTSRYAQLEDYLKNGQWREADEETYRLMITTVGKDVGQYFEPEELLNFDCEVLLAIDGLWVDYSNGHFGFSVQKEIYVKSGAKLDCKYPGNKIWKTFSSSVGWYVNDSYISYSEVTFNASSPRGHLPWGGESSRRMRRIELWGGLGFGELVVLVGVLFYRIEKCKP